MTDEAAPIAEQAPQPDTKPESRRERNERLWERPLPAWQQWLNTFSENWIFAFIVAMAIRSFFLEAYRIPTASMEPVLYGDPWILKADHVVVDRISHFFALPDRWDVTVFQYPKPEVLGPNGSVSSAYDAQGRRVDSIFARPLAHRNFVKRCVILPGDTFYIAGGDIHLKQGDAWVTAHKPDHVQEAIWLAMYEHGAAAGYLPWSAGASEEDGQLVIQPGAAEARFTQPLINLYMKPGSYRVLPMKEAVDARRSGRYGPNLGTTVEVSMTEPLFTWTTGHGHERQGNVWFLKEWEVNRLTSADLDSDRYGRSINPLMDEELGDFRIRFRPAALTGALTLTLAEDDVQRFDLRLAEQGWALQVDGREVASGSDAVVGADWALVHVDDRLWVERDGARLTEIIATQPVVPDEHPSRILWSGSGRLSLAACAIDRDVHYSTEGFLRDYTRGDKDQSYDAGYRSFAEVARMVSQQGEKAPRELLDALGRRQAELVMMLDVREQMLGEDLLDHDRRALQPIGYSPETAITAPPGAYLLLGDNSPFSLDSRMWGWVPEANLRGEVIAVAFPRWKLVH